jgi:hypothetical protein
MNLVSVAGGLVAGFDVTLDGISQYANAAQLQTALKTLNVGDLTFLSALAAHSTEHMLFAYATTTGGVNIADVQFSNTGATNLAAFNTAATANLAVSVHDLVDLVGTGPLGTMNPHNIHLV